jgi:phospholipid/cholesterol/gamma-HCH transport system permease protein
VMRLIQGKARFRMVDVLEAIQQCGWQALPIVSLISLLVGLILAFMGAVQLSMFGAQIYVANLVGIGMTREMGAVMTGVIMAGRTGAAFAANLGTMQVNEEIDALQTMSIDPFAYVITPKLFGILLTIPLLTITADIIGILGGMLIANLSLDLSFLTFFQRALQVADVWNFTNGLIKSVIFGWLIVYIASWYGLQAKRGAEGVGRVTTHSVVTSIFMIIVADSLLSLIFYL